MKITYRNFQNEGIIALDTQMMRPLMVSSHLILQNGVIIDFNYKTLEWALVIQSDVLLLIKSRVLVLHLQVLWVCQSFQESDESSLILRG